MTAARRALVIGGGISGVAVSKFLAEAGLKVTLLEKASQLCAGATWHAAGLVTRFGGSPKLKKLHVKAVDMLTEVHEAHGVDLHLTGSLRLIPKRDGARLAEAKQHVAMAALYDTTEHPTRLIDAEEVQRLHPLISTHNVECAVWTPSDGDVDPTLLTNCLASHAKDAGATLRLGEEVTSVSRRREGTFVVSTGQGEEVEADVLVNCAGLWTKKVAAMLGIHIPAFVIEHQYVISEPLPAIEERQAAGLPRLPVLRDLAASAYIRQERSGLLVGPYEQDCRLTEWGDEPPKWWSFDLFPNALDRIEDNLLGCMDTVPALGEVGIASVVNGPTIWAADGLARVGRSTVPGLYDLNVQTYGIAQSLPLAQWLSHLIAHGEEPFALPDLCALRFGGRRPWATDAFVADKLRETYSHNNTCAFPFENRSAGREHLPKGPLQRALVQAGAVFVLGAGGVETPAYFDPEGRVRAAEVAAAAEAGADPPPRGVHRSFSHHAWAPVAEAEAAHVAAAVGVSHASFSKFEVEGPGAEAWLSRLTTNALPKRDRTRLTYACYPSGRIWAEFTIARVGPSSFYMVGSRDSATVDMARLAAQLPSDGSVRLADVSAAMDILHVAGPRAPALMEAVGATEAAELPFLSLGDVRVLGVPCRALRVSFSGLPGWELHAPAARAAELLDLLTSHPAAADLDLRLFGAWALNALRVEVGFRTAADLDFAYLSEAGVEPFVKRDKEGGFVGQDAAPEVARRSCMLLVDTAPGHEWSVPGDSPIRRRADGHVVGFVTSAARGARTGRTVALGYTHGAAPVAPDVAAAEGWFVDAVGRQWDVQLLERPPAAVTARPAKKTSADAAGAAAAAAAAAVRPRREATAPA